MCLNCSLIEHIPAIYDVIGKEILIPRIMAGLSIVPVVPWEGAPAARGPPPTSCQIFTTLFWRNDDWKRSPTFLGKKCTATDKKILASRMRKWPRLTLVWGPRMVNLALPRKTSIAQFTIILPFNFLLISITNKAEHVILCILNTCPAYFYAPSMSIALLTLLPSPIRSTVVIQQTEESLFLIWVTTHNV